MMVWHRWTGPSPDAGEIAEGPRLGSTHRANCRGVHSNPSGRPPSAIAPRSSAGGPTARSAFSPAAAGCAQLRLRPRIRCCLSATSDQRTLRFGPFAPVSSCARHSSGERCPQRGQVPVCASHHRSTRKRKSKPAHPAVWAVSGAIPSSGANGAARPPVGESACPNRDTFAGVTISRRAFLMQPRGAAGPRGAASHLGLALPPSRLPWLETRAARRVAVAVFADRMGVERCITSDPTIATTPRRSSSDLE